MTKTRKRAIYGGAAVISLAVLGWGASSYLGGPASIPESRLATVERGTLARSVVATGKIEPITKVEIKSKANGIIKLLPVEVDGPDVEFARRSHNRAKSLFDQKLIAMHQLEEARTQLDQAENRTRAAQSQLSVAKARVAEAAANVAQAQASVERAEEELANATIRAPIRGRILARDIEVGSPVSSILNMGAAATSVITMGDISHVFVRGRVDETEIGNLRLGQPARIRVETFKDRTFHGKVTQISPMGVERDNVTNFEVRVSIDNPGHELKANMTANAEIVLEERPNVLIVPEAAVTYDATRKASVDVLDTSERSGRRRVPIKVGISNGSRTQVLEGLKQGDRVVLPS